MPWDTGLHGVHRAIAAYPNSVGAVGIEGAVFFAWLRHLHTSQTTSDDKPCICRSLTSRRLILSADNGHALYGVTSLTESRRSPPRTFVNRSYPGPEVTAGSEGIHVDGEYRA